MAFPAQQPPNVGTRGLPIATSESREETHAAATETRQLIDVFATYFNSGDLNGLATLYEEKDVVFVRMDGQTVRYL
jgi:hypothetical protein